MNIDWTLFYYIGFVACLMIGNTILGVAKAKAHKTFKWETLKEGLIKYGLVLLGTCFVYLAGLLMPEYSFNLPIADKEVTIIEMLILVAIAISAYYAIGIYNNYKAIFNFDSSKLEVEEETTPEEIDDGGIA